MLLPHWDRAVMDEQKLVAYLLNASHPDNGGKAAFFERWGFSSAAADTLRQSIRDMIGRTDAVRQAGSDWGAKYVVKGVLDAPRGATPLVRTVWILEAPDGWPRLVTAYPLRRGQKR